MEESLTCTNHIQEKEAKKKLDSQIEKENLTVELGIQLLTFISHLLQL